MSVTRRQFLQIAGATAAGAVVFTGCQPAPDELQAQSRVRLAEDLLTAYENWYATTCTACLGGCGVVVRVVEGRAKKLEGNPDHPINRGKLCARGQAVVQEQYHPDRIQGPLRRTGARGSGEFAPISWQEGLEQLQARLRGISGSQVGLVTGSLRAHHAMLVDRLVRSWGPEWLVLDPVGETPFREAVRRVFGAEALPDFDIENAQYVLSFGADFLGTWLSPVQYGNEYGIFRQGDYSARRFNPRRARPRGYLAHVEPRMSLTAANADEWLPVIPGTEGLVALSIAQVILSEGLGDAGGMRAFGQASALDSYSPDRVAAQTGIAADRIRHVAREFASRRPSLAIGGGLAGAHTNGTETVAAILALNVLVGNIGREGGIRLNPSSPIEDLPRSVSASRLADWRRFAERVRAGQMLAILVHGANPAHALPAAVGMREALVAAPVVISFSSFLDETTLMADLVLPSHLPLEDWGVDVPDPGPGYQVVSLQQPILQPFFNTRGFADVLLTFAQGLGGAVAQSLSWPSFKDLLRDSLRPLQQERRGSVQEADFERFWIAMLQRGGWWDEGRRQATPATTPNLQTVVGGFRPAQYAGEPAQFPYHLVLFPHHTLGAGELAHLPWLQATPDPITSAVWQTWVEVNPRTAAEIGLREGDIAAIEAPGGRRIEAAIYPNPATPPWTVAIPIGQGHAALGRWAKDRGANPLDLLGDLTDEATGTLSYGASRVRIIATGRRVTLPKFEGTAPAVQVPERPVAPVTRGT